MDLIGFRRDLHAHPGTAFNVGYAADRIAEVLEDAGLHVTRGVGGAGLVATLDRGGSGGRAIGLRADMDALPIEEQTNLPYRSTVPGVFHGCGHDGHSTMLMGAALRLAGDETLDRTVHFIFQPDEENGTGAQAMIDDGLFDRFPMQAIYGLHNMPGMEVGTFATQTGPFCAFEDNFAIHVTGKGGHASMPEAGVDAIVVGAALVGQLQTIVARNVPAWEHGVVSVTEFESDGARNVIASNVQIRGDCRGFTPEVSQLIATRMGALVQDHCAAMGATGRLDYSTSFQPVVNDAAATAAAVSAASAVGQVDAHHGQVGFSEDFAAFAAHVPGAFILAGNGTQGANAMPLHNPGYDFNDDAIKAGVAYWTGIAKAG